MVMVPRLALQSMMYRLNGGTMDYDKDYLSRQQVKPLEKEWPVVGFDLAGTAATAAAAIRDLTAKLEAERKEREKDKALWADSWATYSREVAAREAAESRLASALNELEAMRFLSANPHSIQAVKETFGPLSLWTTQGIKDHDTAIFERTRERCAKVCDVYALKCAERQDEAEGYPEEVKGEFSGGLHAAQSVAAAIRALAPEESAAPNKD